MNIQVKNKLYQYEEPIAEVGTSVFLGNILFLERASRLIAQATKQIAVNINKILLMLSSV